MSSLVRVREPYQPAIVGVGDARVGAAPPAPPGKVATFTQPPDGRVPDVNYVGFSWWWVDDPSLPTAGYDDPEFLVARALNPALTYEAYLASRETAIPGADDPEYMAIRSAVPGLTYDAWMKSKVATAPPPRCPGPYCIEIAKPKPAAHPPVYPPVHPPASGTSRVTIVALVVAAGAAVYYFFIR